MPLGRAGVWGVALLGIAAAGAIFVLGRGRPRTFSGPVTLGGVSVDADTLEAGKRVYEASCAPCHGARGDGHGPAAAGLHPPPRDLTQGVYEFAFVATPGSLPSDDDLERTIRDGLRGTAMPALHASEREVHAVAQYVKTFAAAWATGAAGTRLELADDPWKGAEAAARERGERLYHATALCASCHPNYATRARIAELMLAIKHVTIVAFRDDMYGPMRRPVDPKDPEGDGAAPDFTKDELRTMRGPRELAGLPADEREPAATADVARVIAAGVGGSGMKGWHFIEPYVDTSSGESWEGDKDVWALAHYVRSLAALRGTPAAAKLRAELDGQPAWVAPGR